MKVSRAFTNVSRAFTNVSPAFSELSPAHGESLPASSPKLVASVLKLVAPIFVVCALAGVAHAQGRPGPGGRSAAEMNERRGRIEREMIHGGPDAKPVKTAERKSREDVTAEVRQDFERAQAAYNTLVHALRAGGPLDYSVVADASGEINKRAARLRQNLALPRPAEGEGAAARKEQPHAAPELDAAQVRPALVALAGRVVSFFTSPVFESRGVLDVQASRKAGLDLERIIELSDQIKRSAARLAKPHH